MGSFNKSNWPWEGSMPGTPPMTTYYIVGGTIYRSVNFTLFKLVNNPLRWAKATQGQPLGPEVTRDAALNAARQTFLDPLFS